MKYIRVTHYLLLFFLLFGLSSCLTHYQLNYQFYKSFENGNFEQAQKNLASDKKGATGKAKLIYFLNQGIVHQMLGQYELSNDFFEQAYILGEDYRKNYLNEILAYFTNPLIVQYRGEDFELLLIHYYKALNFLNLGDKEKALVECRRLNIKLNAMSDNYKSDNKYTRDAFIHTLMGLVYDANKDYNNAFIAYRNAVEIYQTDYKKLFNIDVPDQLKRDVMRTAYLMGFTDELQFYEREFEMQFQKEEAGNGDLIFLWHNGFGPIKSEWSINFAINRFDSRVVFVNDQLNLNFPFPLELRTDDDGNEIDPLGGISAIRVAFPKYIERPEYFRSAELTANGQTKPLELAENLNDIARKTLKERMVLELGKALLRLAIKKGSEELLRQDDKDGLASILSIINAATEQADTRSWQAIPHSIYYTRMSLAPGDQKVSLNTIAPGGVRTFDFNFNINQGKTIFHTFHSLEIDPSFRNYSYNNY